MISPFVNKIKKMLNQRADLYVYIIKGRLSFCDLGPIFKVTEGRILLRFSSWSDSFFNL